MVAVGKFSPLVSPDCYTVFHVVLLLHNRFYQFHLKGFKKFCQRSSFHRLYRMNMTCGVYV